MKKLINIFSKISFSKIDGGKKKYPKVVQLPITYQCNSRCQMCNIWQMDHSNEASIEEFRSFLKDDIFKEVEAVGINGGEPSLVSNLPEYADAILSLPKLKSLNIISHGFNTSRILKAISEIYSLCKKRNISFHVSISLDGVGGKHDEVRGITGVFEKTMKTIDELHQNQSKYCDTINLGCTILKQNIDNLIELDTYISAKGYEIKYRLGIENKRIESWRFTDQFSVKTDLYRQTAIEFFHYKLSTTKNLQEKFKYFSIYSWLNSDKPKRLLGCRWKDEGITLDSRGELYYCAVSSDPIGSLRSSKGEAIFFSEENINYRKSIVKNECDNCIHDYSGRVEISNIFIFIKYLSSRYFNLLRYMVNVNLMK